MVQSKEKVIELGKKLPWGAKKEISKRTGITEKTVSLFFRGSNTRYDNSLKILKEANSIVKEMQM